MLTKKDIELMCGRCICRNCNSFVTCLSTGKNSKFCLGRKCLNYADGGLIGIVRKCRYFQPRINKKRGFEVVSGQKAQLPKRATKGSAGYDFVAPEDIFIPARGYSKLFFTNVKAYMPKNEVLLLYIRSSMGIKHGLSLANGTGIIDSDYYNNQDNEGNIGCMLFNASTDDYMLKAGERFMQGIFGRFSVADGDHAKSKRMAGLGSTGSV